MVTHDLDRKSKRILEAIYNYGGEAETGQIKEYTGVEKNGVIHYRINEKLEPANLVETRKVENGDRPLGVKMTSLTDEGRQVVGKILDEGDGPSLTKQMQMLREEVESLQDTVFNYEGKVLKASEHSTEALETARKLDEALDRFEEIEGEFEEIQRRFDHVTKQARELSDIEQGLQEALKVLSKARILQKSTSGYWVIHPDLARFEKLAKAGVFGAMLEEHENGAQFLGLNPDIGHPGTVEAVEEQTGIRVPEVPGDLEKGEEVDPEEHPDPRPPVIDPRPEVTIETAEKLNQLEEYGVLDSLLSAVEDNAEVPEDGEVRVKVEVIENTADTESR